MISMIKRNINKRYDESKNAQREHVNAMSSMLAILIRIGCFIEKYQYHMIIYDCQDFAIRL